MRPLLLLLLLAALAGCGGPPPAERSLELRVSGAGYAEPRLSAAAGEIVFIRFHNDDRIAHSLTVLLPAGQRTVSAEAGVDAVLSFPAGAPGRYRFFCPVPGHAEEGELLITEAP